VKVSAQKEQEGEEFNLETGTPYSTFVYGTNYKWGSLTTPEEEEAEGGVAIMGLAKGNGKKAPLPGVSLFLSVEEALALYESLGSTLEQIKEHYRNFPNGIKTPEE
jgi:hypothetical protein